MSSHSSSPQSLPPRRRSTLPWLLLTLLLIAMTACGAFTVLTLGGVAKTTALVRNIFDGGEIVVLDDQPAVITQIRALGRLESASFTVEKVLEGSVDQGNELLNLLLGDRLLFIAHGEVIAGVDLTEMKEGDITVSEDRQGVTLRLPPARILTQRLDNTQSRVYDREQGLFSKGDPELESRVRQDAENAILQAACEGDILNQAAQNAQRQVQILLLALEFKNVQFQPVDAAATSGCP